MCTYLGLILRQEKIDECYDIRLLYSEKEYHDARTIPSDLKEDTLFYLRQHLE